MGFSVPMAAWLRGPLRARMRESVLGERLLGTGFFNRETLLSMAQAHESGRRDFSAPLWTLIMFDAFLRRMERENPPAGYLPVARAGARTA